MKFRYMVAIFSCILLLTSQGIYAGPKEIKAKLKKSMPGLEITSIRPSAIKGIYEVEVGAQIAYVTSDGEHLLIGRLIEISTKKNLTEVRQEEILSKQMKKLGKNDFITIKPKKVKRTITVFTDVDCPYCSKLHREVPKLTKAGVSVQYLLYPRNGPQSPTFQKSVSVWCADDQVEAIGKAKRGESVPNKNCKNPVMSNFNLGRQLGISGTPTTILDNGKMIGGYLPAEHILKKLGM